jgi:hypothetical protein
MMGKPRVTGLVEVCDVVGGALTRSSWLPRLIISPSVLHTMLSNKLRKAHLSTAELRWPARLEQEQNTRAGCSKRPPSKAAASEEAMRTLFGMGSL